MTNHKSQDVHQEFFDDEEQEFDLNAYIRRYFRFWYLFPIFLAITITCAFFYLKITQPVYSTKTTILIKDEKKGLGGSQGDILSELSTQFGGNKLVENELEIIKSQTLMEQVIKDLSLDVSYTSKDGLRTINLYSATPVIVKPEVITELGYEEPLLIRIADSTHFRFNNEDQLFTFGQRFNNQWGAFVVEKGAKSDFTDIEISFSETKKLAEGMLKKLSVQQPNVKSTVLELTYEDVNVQRSKDVLNKLLDVYVQSSLNDKNGEASNTLKFIENRLGLITGELGDVEKDVESTAFP
jgi:tyrosine-protein kinase Etk/Wzc